MLQCLEALIEDLCISHWFLCKIRLFFEHFLYSLLVTQFLFWDFALDQTFMHRLQRYIFLVGFFGKLFLLRLSFSIGFGISTL